MMFDRKVLQDTTISDLISAFAISGEYKRYDRIDLGHINDTFTLYFKGERGEIRYIVQRINTTIFKDTNGLINNIVLVTKFLKDNIQNEKGERYETLNVLATKEGKYYFEAEDGACYRIYDFVENSKCYQFAPDAEVFKQSAIAFARFQKCLKGFDTAQIVDSIPNFHNTRMRFDALKAAIQNAIPNRLAGAESEIKFALEREKYVDIVVNLLVSGGLPTRVTHNDTKLNNVLFDAVTDKAVCVIDLDTIMRGSLLYDFGDSIRFGCSTAAEDEKDLEKVLFDFDKFTAYVEGYLSVLSDSITDKETDLLAFSGILMTYECGIRFLADYLTGDSYFKTAYDTHNLVRAKNQFKLVLEMEKQLSRANEAVNSIKKNF